MNILAFDSGLERTGYAIFSVEGNDHTLKDYGCIFTSKYDSLEERISQLSEGVENLIGEFEPEHMVLEQIFSSINKKTVISVAQAQGAVIALAGAHKISVSFLTPNEIKQTVTGYGNSDKKGVQKMVKILLNMKEVPEPDDTADAIACGLTYCTMKKFKTHP